MDRSPSIASAALVSALHMSGRGTAAGAEVIKRWSNEAQEAVSSDSVMVQYHALGLLYHIRYIDRLESPILSSLTGLARICMSEIKKQTLSGIVEPSS